MPKSHPPNAKVLDLLGVAIAILGEEMNTLGVQAPKTQAKRQQNMRKLKALTHDAASLAEACDVLIRRPELKL